MTWSGVFIEHTYETRKALSFATPLRGFYGGSGLFRTTDGGTSWSAVNSGRVNDQIVHLEFVNRWRGWALGNAGVYTSRDGGSSWELCHPFVPPESFSHFDMIDSLNGWAVNTTHRYRTTDGGITWTGTAFDSLFDYVRGVQFYDEHMGVIYEVRERSTNYASVMVTTDGGATWDLRRITNTEFLSSWFKMQFTDPRHLWFANQQGVWLSRDTARTWTHVAPYEAFDSGFEFSDSLNGYTNSSFGALAHTTDGGATWSIIQKPYPSQTLDVALPGPDYFGRDQVVMAGYEGALFEYVEGADMRTGSSFTRSALRTIAVVREPRRADVWIGTDGFQVLHASVYISTDVSEPQEVVPSTVALRDNYPNPFNSSTMVTFDVARRSFVTLSVYNVLGEEVAVLVHDELLPGHHARSFDASGLASGVYLCRLSVDPLGGGSGYRAVKKMLLLR